MSIVINTNIAAQQAATNLGAANDMLQKSLNRLSSGKRIVSPSDDAGGLAVSMKMQASIKRADAANTNVGNAVSFLKRRTVRWTRRARSWTASTNSRRSRPT